MANTQETAANVLDKVKAIMAGIKFFSDDNGNTSFYLPDLFNLNVVDFVSKFFDTTQGQEKVINIVSDFVTDSLTTVESSVKLIILGYLESMLSCSVKPIITKKMILDGVYFDLQEIDLFNILNYAPVIGSSLDGNAPGRYLYFGTSAADGVYTIDDLYKCRDFNAFLWHAKNCPGHRVVWKHENDVEKPAEIHKLPGSETVYTTNRTFMFPKNSGHYITVNTPCVKVKEGNYKTLTFVDVMKDGVLQDGFTSPVPIIRDKYSKQAKQNGIVTLEYNSTTDDLSDAENNEMLVQEPLQNVLHVFIGCCDEIPTSTKTGIKEQIDNVNEKISQCSTLKDDLNGALKNLNKKKHSIKKSRNGEINPDEKESLLNQVNGELKKVSDFLLYMDNDDTVSISVEAKNLFGSNYSNDTITLTSLDNTYDFYQITIPSDIINDNLKVLNVNKRSLVASYNNESTNIFPTASSNYYYLHPLVEFNSDLLFSMKLFDPKVVVAQIINALIGCLEYSANELYQSGVLNGSVSLQGQIIQAELGETIEKIIENDDDIISDCFFNFSNNDYNLMLQKSEMSRAGIHTLDGKTQLKPSTPEEIMGWLNSLASDADKSEIKTAINHSLMCAVSSVNTTVTDIDYTPSINGAFGVDWSNMKINLIEELIKKLVYAIVSVILMPKLYLIIMFNLKLMNSTNTSFNLLEYIEYCKSMIIDLCKLIRDMVIEFFKDKMVEILQELIDQFKPLIIQEQYKYYKNLLANCTECFKFHGNENDWSMAAVNYADITDPITSTNEEC